MSIGKAMLLELNSTTLNKQKTSNTCKSTAMPPNKTKTFSV
jgi:hypothetical protein